MVRLKGIFNTHSEVRKQMKKSQLITLVILFVAVSLFIWIGACSDSKNEISDPDSSISISKTPAGQTSKPDNTGPTATAPSLPTKKPVTEIDLTQLSGLSKEKLDIFVSYDTKDFSDPATVAALEQSTYLLSNPGTGSNDIYMSFLLHYSDVNSRVEKLLDIAKNKNIKFTFYVSSMYLNEEANVETLKRIYNEGHTIGSRGDKSIDQLSVSAEALRDSLLDMEKKLKSIVGEGAHIKFYSPDNISERNARLATLMGYTVTFKLCNFVTDSGSRDQTYNGIQFQSSEISDKLVTQVSSYVDWAMSQGYTFKGFKGE